MMQAKSLLSADLSGGDTHTFESSSIEIVGVPEPSTAVLMAAVLILAGRRQRTRGWPFFGRLRAGHAAVPNFRHINSTSCW